MPMMPWALSPRRFSVTIALVVNGIPDLQLSGADGLASLKVLLADRENQGCSISPTAKPSFGIQYRIRHPASGNEVVYLTGYADLDNDDWEADGEEAA
jgi:hypothetical protein